MPTVSNDTWLALHTAFRCGYLPIAELSRQFKVHEKTIQARARDESWTRDLAPVVREHLTAILSASLVPETPRASLKGQAKQDRLAVELAAETQAAMIREHRRDLATLRLQAYQFFLEMQEADHEGKPLLPAKVRAYMYHETAFALSKVIPLERQAVGLDKDTQRSPGTPVNIVIQMDGRSAPVPVGPQAAAVFEIQADDQGVAVIPAPAPRKTKTAITSKRGRGRPRKAPRAEGGAG